MQWLLLLPLHIFYKIELRRLARPCKAFLSYFWLYVWGHCQVENVQSFLSLLCDVIKILL